MTRVPSNDLQQPRMDVPVALITGGSRGLSRSIVRSIAGRGTDVIFTYQSHESDAVSLVAETEEMGRRAATLQLDVSDSNTFEAFANERTSVLRGWGTDRFHFLVNNTGHSLQASIAETTAAQFDKIMDVHIKGPIFLTQKLLPQIADGGRIVNVYSARAR